MLSDEEIRRVSALSEDELLVEIGQAVEGREGLPAFPNRARLIRKGRDWFEGFLLEAKTVICNNPQVYANIKGKQSVLAEVAQTVALAIADATLVPPVPIATVSALIARRGVENLCADMWAKGIAKN